MKGLAALLVLVVLAASASTAAPSATAAAEEDVRLLAERMEALHPNLFHDLSPEIFRAVVDDLARRAPTLEPNELLVELMRLAAMPGVRDGHGGIWPLDGRHRRRLHAFPLALYDFPEGMYVTAEAAPLGLVGSRLVAVAGMPLDDVLALVRPLVPRDNEWSLRGQLHTFLLSPEVLHGLHVIDAAGPAVFTFARPDGSRRNVVLTPMQRAAYLAALRPQFGAWGPYGLPRRAAPMYLALRRRPLWTRTYDRGRVAYIGYNQTLVDTWRLSRWVLRRAGMRGFRRVIVDLRLNGGGDNQTYGELLQALRNPKIDRRGRLVVLVSRSTFSAAANLAAELDRMTNARFVGEPSGGSPNFYSDTDPVTLPFTGIVASVARIYWEKGGPADRRLAIEPDVRVELTARDFFAGRDPVLAAALALR